MIPGADVPGAVPIVLNINGKEHHIALEPRVTLLDALRENLQNGMEPVVTWLKARAARVKPAAPSHVVELGIDARR